MGILGKEIREPGVVKEPRALRGSRFFRTARERDLTNAGAMSKCFQLLKPLCRKKMPRCVWSFIHSLGKSFIHLLVYPSIDRTNI